MKSVIHVYGPPSAGPGERKEMQERAQAFLNQASVTEKIRIDVPQRGSDGEAETGALRAELGPLIPALQSGSLFGDRVGVEVVDAQWIQSSEADVLSDLLSAADPAAVTVVFVSAGALPARLSKAIKPFSEVHKVERFNAGRTREWLKAAVRERGAALNADAMDALIERFGTDVGSMGQALDQLVGSQEPVTGKLIRDRFKNRPDEGMWLYTDAIAAGRVGEALRHLQALLIHSHPLALVAYLEGELRKRAYASAAPSLEEFGEWLGGRVDWRVEKAWKARGKASDSDLHRSLSALSRADRLLKSAPEETHRLTMERLTIALCRWWGGGR